MSLLYALAAILGSLTLASSSNARDCKPASQEQTFYDLERKASLRIRLEQPLDVCDANRVFERFYRSVRVEYEGQDIIVPRDCFDGYAVSANEIFANHNPFTAGMVLQAYGRSVKEGISAQVGWVLLIDAQKRGNIAHCSRTEQK